MLHSVKQLYGYKLDATDGEIGCVRDFYFDELHWTIRFVVADTGTWLSRRQVLIAPQAFGEFHHSGRLLRLHLTRQQIESCPSIDSFQPLTRHYEADYYHYYGWPCYWQGDEIWGTSPIPLLEYPENPHSVAKEQGNLGIYGFEDCHLRSTQTVGTYHIQTDEGVIGHLCDFMMDGQSWAIRQLVVKTGNWLAGREVHLPTDKIGGINYDQATVFIDMSNEAIEQCPP